jgi:biopolymer transport protein TolR
MAMSGSNRAINADLNVTPMIDILLVLLIIFMIMLPVTPQGLSAIVPQDSPEPQKIQPDSIVVIQLSAAPDAAQHPSVKLNQQPVPWNELPDTLQKILLKRSNKSAFVKADGELDFQEVASVIDIAHHSGVLYVGLMTKEPAQR